MLDLPTAWLPNKTILSFVLPLIVLTELFMLVLLAQVLKSQNNNNNLIDLF